MQRFDLPDLPRGYEWKIQLVTDDDLVEQNTAAKNVAGKNIKEKNITNQDPMVRKVRNLVQKQYINLSPRSIVIFKSQNIKGV